MLTWAIVFLAVKLKADEVGIHLFVAIITDGIIFTTLFGVLT